MDTSSAWCPNFKWRRRLQTRGHNNKIRFCFFVFLGFGFFKPRRWRRGWRGIMCRSERICHHQCHDKNLLSGRRLPTWLIKSPDKWMTKWTPNDVYLISCTPQRPALWWANINQRWQAAGGVNYTFLPSALHFLDLFGPMALRRSRRREERNHNKEEKYLRQKYKSLF